MPLDDEPTFRHAGNAAMPIGVFQLEGSGMRDILRKLKPDRFEDIDRAGGALPARPDGQHPDLHQRQERPGEAATTCIPR